MNTISVKARSTSAAMDPVETADAEPDGAMTAGKKPSRIRNRFGRDAGASAMASPRPWPIRRMLMDEHLL